MVQQVARLAFGALFVAAAVSAAGAGCSSCATDPGETPAQTDAGFDGRDATHSESAPADVANPKDAPNDSATEEEEVVVGPWDPVWYKSTPASWPEMPVGARPDCGPHCRVIASAIPGGSADRTPKASDTWVIIQGQWPGQVASTGVVAVDLRDPNNPKEVIIDDGKWLPGGKGAGHAAVDGHIALTVSGNSSMAFVVLTNLETGERKLAFEVPMELYEAGFHPGTSGSALALPYAYWMTTPADVFYRFDTRNGELKTSNKVAACEYISGTSTGLGACAGAGYGLVVIDFDKGTTSRIAQTAYQQTNGMLSQDGSEAIWVDFRDPGPNGEHGSYDSPWGGEIYWKTLGEAGDERLTFDTPSSPAMKTSPWAQGGHLAWITRAGTDWPNPTGSSVYWYGVGQIVLRPKGKPIVTLPGNYFGAPRPIAPGIVAGYLDEATQRGWEVLIDWP